MNSLHDKPLVFIGPMGSGKSSLARRAAAKFGGKIFDTDSEFTRRYGAIKAFFESKGESEFRKVEQELMSDAVRSGADFIATGGGAVLNRRGMNALRASCDIVFLDAPTEALKQRIEKSDRPLKNNLEATLRDRMPLYIKYADWRIDTSVDSLYELTHALAVPRRNRYDIVLCDSDETLLDFQKARSQSIKNTVETLKLDCDPSAADAAYKSVVCDVWHRLERGELDRDELERARVELLAERLGIDIDIDVFNRIYIEQMRSTRFVLDGAVRFLERLRARAIKSYIITNSFTNMAEKRLEPLRPYVRGEFVSEEMGAYKPDRRFFDIALERIGCSDRTRVIVFGDSETSDIAGARAAELDSCLLDKTGQKQTAADFSVADYDGLLKIL